MNSPPPPSFLLQKRGRPDGRAYEKIMYFAPFDYAGLTYQGKAADTWAVGITLYYMVMGCFPFMGETLQDQYDKVC